MPPSPSQAPSLAPSPSPTLRVAKAPFARCILLCGRCAKRLEGEGFGKRGRESLRKALKRELKGGGYGRKVRLIETSCLKLCPNRRQVAATPDLLAQGRLLVVEPGTEASAVLALLFGAPLAEPAPTA